VIGRAGLLVKRKDKPVDFISVVVLTHNRKYLLYCCLQSLFAQDYPPDRFEILVIDDGSNDGTKQIVDSFLSRQPNLRFFYQVSEGVSAARNQGIRLSRGHIISFIADDYVVPPRYVSSVANFFSEHTEICAVRFLIEEVKTSFLGRVNYLYYAHSLAQQLIRSKRLAAKTRWDRLTLNFVRLERVPKTFTSDHDLDASGAAAYRREVFDEVGPFCQTLKRGEDTDMALRLQRANIPLFFDPRLVVGCRFSSRFKESIVYYFQKGYWFQNFMMKEGQAGEPGCCVLSWCVRVVRAFFRLIGILLIEPISRAWQGRSALEVLSSLPVMFIWVTAYRCGVICRSLQNRQIGFSSSGCQTSK